MKGKGYCCEVSIHKDSLLEKSNMTLQEIIKYIYWWTVVLCCPTPRLVLVSELAQELRLGGIVLDGS